MLDSSLGTNFSYILATNLANFIWLKKPEFPERINNFWLENWQSSSIKSKISAQSGGWKSKAQYRLWG